MFRFNDSIVVSFSCTLCFNFFNSLSILLLNSSYADAVIPFSIIFLSFSLTIISTSSNILSTSESLYHSVSLSVSNTLLTCCIVLDILYIYIRLFSILLWFLYIFLTHKNSFHLSFYVMPQNLLLS